VDGVSDDALTLPMKAWPLGCRTTSQDRSSRPATAPSGSARTTANLPCGRRKGRTRHAESVLPCIAYVVSLVMTLW